MMRPSALLIEKLLGSGDTRSSSGRNAELKRLLESASWIVHECEECPNSVEDYVLPELVIAHDTDVHRPTLIAWCGGHRSQWLLLHTHAWNNRQVSHYVELGVKVVELGSEDLLRHLSSFLERWSSADSALVEELGASTWPQNVVALYLLALAVEVLEGSKKSRLLEENWSDLLEAARSEAAARRLSDLPRSPLTADTAAQWASELRRCLASIAETGT